MLSKVNGKNKGNSFERKIANLLSDRFKNYLNINKGFRRNSDSGSYFGGKNVSRTENYDLDNAYFGDLMCPKNFIYSVECKHYKTAPSFQSILNGNVKQWDLWIKQAEQDSLGYNKTPLLIIKYNNVPEFVFITEELDIKSTIKYKEYYSYTLDGILGLPDEKFFDTSTKIE